MKCPDCSGPLSDNRQAYMSCIDCGTAVYHDIYDFTLIQAQQYFAKAEICIEDEKYEEALVKLKECLLLRKGALYKYHENIAATMDLIAKVYAITGLYQRYRYMWGDDPDRTWDLSI